MSPLEHDDLLAKGDILGGQVGYDIEVPAEPDTASFDELKHQSILCEKRCKFNGGKAYE